MKNQIVEMKNPEKLKKELIGHMQIGHDKPKSLIGIGVFLIIFFTIICILFVPISFTPNENSIIPKVTLKTNFTNTDLAIYFVLIAVYTFGLVLISKGLLDYFKQRKKQFLKRKYPNEPWKYEYLWDEKGVELNDLKYALKLFLWIFFILIFSSPHIYIIYSIGIFSSFSIIAGIVIGFFIVVTSIGFLYVLFRYFKYGTTFLRFGSFPFFIGEDIKLYLKNNKLLNYANEIKVILRYVEEKREFKEINYGEYNNVIGTLNPKSKNKAYDRVVHYELYSQEKIISLQNFPKSESIEIPLTFISPINALPNDLMKNYPKYWEVEINADVKGINYQQFFILPVYKRR